MDKQLQLTTVQKFSNLAIFTIDKSKVLFQDETLWSMQDSRAF